MLDVSKKPTSTDIAYRIRLLHNFTHTAALFAMNADYPDRTAQEAMQDQILLIDELCAELDIMAQVLDNYSEYTDFEQLIPERCEIKKNRAQINAEIIAGLEKLGVIPTEEKDGERV